MASNSFLPAFSSEVKEVHRFVLMLCYSRSLVNRMNLDGHGSSVIVSPRQPSDSRPKSAGHALKSAAVGTDEDLSDDDDEFDSERSPRFSSTGVTPRVSWVEKEHQMIDMSTQTVVHSGRNFIVCLEITICGREVAALQL